MLVVVEIQPRIFELGSPEFGGQAIPNVMRSPAPESGHAAHHIGQLVHVAVLGVRMQAPMQTLCASVFCAFGGCDDLLCAHQLCRFDAVS